MSSRNLIRTAAFAVAACLLAFAQAAPATLIIHYDFENDQSSGPDAIRDTALGDGVAQHMDTSGSIEFNTVDFKTGAKSAQFNGAEFDSGYYDTAGVPSGDPLQGLSDNSYTIAFWMKIDGSDSSNLVPTSWSSGLDPSPFSMVVAASGTAAGGEERTLVWFQNEVPHTFTGTVTEDEWVHVAVSMGWGGSGNQARVYLDGVFDSQSADFDPIVVPNNQHFRLGSDNGQLWYTGLLDAYRLYDESLDDAAIFALFSGASAPAIPAPAALPAGLALLTLAATRRRRAGRN